MARDRIFRWRIDDDDYRRLQRAADAAGLTKADLIRKSLGWPLRTEREQAAAGAPAAAPGLTALEQLNKRIAEGGG